MKKRKMLRKVLALVLIVSMLMTSSFLTNATENMEQDIQEMNADLRSTIEGIDDLTSMTPEEISGLASEQIEAIIADDFALLSQEQLEAFTEDQLAVMTEDQKAAFVSALSAYDEGEAEEYMEGDGDAQIVEDPGEEEDTEPSVVEEDTTGSEEEEEELFEDEEDLNLDLDEIMDEDEEDTEETSEERVFTKTVGGVTVTVTAGKDVLPEDAELSVTQIKKAENLEEIKEAIAPEIIEENKSIEEVLAFDIKFLLDGKEVQPNGTVQVSFTNTGLNEGEGIEVYHVNDSRTKATNMDADTDGDGDASIETTHFSDYVIVQKGDSTVKVTIQHYLEGASGTSDATELYLADEKNLTVGGVINDYNKATNYTVDKVVKIASDGTETEVSNPSRIEVSEDSTYRVYYTTSEKTTTGDVKFYDYTVKAGQSGNTYYSINQDSNYASGASKSNKITAGNTSNNYDSYSYGDVKSTNEKQVNFWTGSISNNGDTNKTNDEKNAKYAATGIVSGLKDDGSVNFGDYYDPGLFNDSDKTVTVNKQTRYLRQYINDLQLVFTRTGDSFQLTEVQDASGNQLTTSGENFFPLDSYRKDYEKSADQKSDSNISGDDANDYHNYFFGMRYDVNFTIGDYVGDMIYKFTGDDDLWVLLDGKVIMDLGGIHDALTDTVDIWDELGITAGEQTDTQKTEQHTLTVLYMERGAGESNCNMKFTIPNAKVASVTNVPVTDFTFKKTNSTVTNLLSGATFKLTNQTDENDVYTATSDANGNVTFTNLREGTYKLTETAPPDGYVSSQDTWIVEVKVSGETATATLYKSDGTTEYDTTYTETSTDESTNTSTSVTYPAIVNYTSKEIIETKLDSNKTATVVDWDQRTYEINITAKSKVTSTTTTTTGGVADVMLVLDVSGSMAFTTDTGETLGSYTSKGTYSSVLTSLDTSKIYYYSESSGNQGGGQGGPNGNNNNNNNIDRNIGSYYQYATGTMVYLNGSWIYYDGSDWNTLSSTSSGTVYSCNTRMTALKEAVVSFLKSTAASSSKSKIGITTFSSSSRNGNGNDRDHNKTYSISKIGGQGTLEDMIKWVCQLKAKGGTDPQVGLSNANTQLGSVSGNPEYVILFTDGEPTGSGSSWSTSAQTGAESQASTLKTNGATIYTIGFGTGDQANAFLGGGTYNETTYPGIATDASHAKTAGSEADLLSIFKTIQQTITQNLDITDATVTDVIDSRFELLDDDGNVITMDTEGVNDAGEKATLANGGYVELENGGKVYYNSTDGTFYVRWSEQIIPHDSQWSNTVTVKAKDEYIGGNAITTNNEATITTGDGTHTLPQPTVNVKADLLVNNKEVTIYKGDSVPTDEKILNALFDTSNPQGIVKGLNEEDQTVTYTMGSDGTQIKASDFTLTWYTDAACTQSITKAEMAAAKPSETTYYYLKVTYNALGTPTDESNANTTLGETSYQAGTLDTTDSTYKVTADNSGSPDDFASYKGDPYGVYKINVISGAITIKKVVTEAITDEGGKDFTFKVTKDGTDYTTVTVHIDKGDTESNEVNVTIPTDTNTTTQKQLPRGTYKVTEVTVTGWAVKDMTIGTDTNCEYTPNDTTKGTATTDSETATFVMGNKESDGSNVISTDYSYDSNDGGTVGEVTYTNEPVIKGWYIVKRSTTKTADDKNILLEGAKFKLESTDNTDNTYYGASDANGTVQWYSDEARETAVTQIAKGTYTLTETEAPTGYARSEETWTLTFNKNGKLLSVKDKSGNAVTSTEETLENGTTRKVYYYDNTAAYELPKSGGMGTYLFTISGVAFIMTAFLLMVLNRRKRVPMKARNHKR